MRKIKWTDARGFKRVSFVRDSDPDEFAPHGIPVSPPNMELVIDENAVRDLHNILVDRGLFTAEDVEKHEDSITSAILTAFRKRVILAYRSMEE